MRSYHFFSWHVFSVVASELLVISLDLVKNRVCVMSTEMRRNFVHSVLASLIEKSADAKVLKTIVRMVEEWVKAKVSLFIFLILFGSKM